MKKVLFFALIFVANMEIAFSQENSPKTTLLCSGYLTNYGEGGQGIPAKNFLVKLYEDKLIVSPGGILVGDYQITKVTDERYLFEKDSGDVGYVGGLSRYTGEMVIQNKVLGVEGAKLTWHLLADCKKGAKRLF